MSLRTPLGRVRGLGSAREGVSHWWWQRITAIALVPLGLWFVLAFLARVGAGHAVAAAWLASPWSASLAVLFVACMFFHGQLGLQVIIEDYVHTVWLKIASLIAIKLLTVLFGVAAIVAVLKLL